MNSDNNFQNWLNKLKNAWENLDPQGAANLFAKDVEYYESALKTPCADWDKVFDLWKVIPTNQKNVTFNFEIIAISENLCVANWRVERLLLPQNTEQKIDGIFIFRLNNEGLCNYFKQWRTIKEN